MSTNAWWGLGQRVAPPRFVLFAVVFAAALAVGIPEWGRGRGIMAAFDVAALVFLLAMFLAWSMVAAVIYGAPPFFAVLLLFLFLRHRRWSRRW